MVGTSIMIAICTFSYPSLYQSKKSGGFLISISSQCENSPLKREQIRIILTEDIYLSSLSLSL